MTDLWLVAHKCRGEVAFSVAEQIQQGTPTDPGPWWIIPTVGHRVHPFWAIPLASLYARGNSTYAPILEIYPEMPADAKDMFAFNETFKPPAPKKKGLIDNLDFLDKELGI